MPISIRLAPEIETRLNRLAKRTGRTKTYYITEAVLEHLDDLEDIYIAEKRLQALREGRSRTWTQEEVERSLGLAD